MEADLVVFRKWRDSGTIIALFPELPADLLRRFCDAYEHVGQHGGADYDLVVRHTVPATAAEAEPLAKELTQIGYQLRPVRRASSKHPERRRSEAKSLRERIPAKPPENVS